MRHSGQAGLVAIAITIMIALVLSAVTIAGLSQMNARRTVVTRHSLQTHYVAQAGIQEALATRMLPRSNYLNFVSGLPAQVTPYLQGSGLVYRDPANRTQLVGVYRYLVLGGDPSRRADGSYYDIPPGPPFSVGPNTTQNPANPVPRLVTFQTSPPDSPFYIISNGLICKGSDDSIGVDQFVNSPTTNAAAIGLNPACKPGYSLDEVTLLTRVNMEPEVTGRDRLNQTTVSKSRNNIVLPVPAFVPGSGWATNVNFDNVWMHGTTTNTPVRPTRVVFFEFGPNRIFRSVDLTGGTPATIQNIPTNASIMLYFDGPIDYRSISLGTNRYDRDLTGCKTGGAVNCAIRLFANPAALGTGGTAYGGMTVVPIMPYMTKVLLLAPIGNTASSGTNYEIRVATNQIRSFSYAPGAANTFIIPFRTCPVSGGPPPCP